MEESFFHISFKMFFCCIVLFSERIQCSKTIVENRQFNANSYHRKRSSFIFFELRTKQRTKRSKPKILSQKEEETNVRLVCLSKLEKNRLIFDGKFFL